MKMVTVDDPCATARELVEMAKKEPVVLREKGGRTFAVIEVDDSDIESWSLGSSPQFLQLIERSRARAEAEGWLTTDQVREQLGIASQTKS